MNLKQLVIEQLSDIGYVTDAFTEEALRKALTTETNELAIDVLSNLMKNIEIAKEKNYPLCQDTGIVVFWVKIPSKNYDLTKIEKILNEAVEESFSSNNYRKSIVNDPINRINTKNNTPAIIHYEICETDKLEISMMLKGAGSENMSALKMLPPNAGIQGIRDFVLETVKTNGANACPPLTIGIGIGGNFETCALLAKKSLFRPNGVMNKDEFWAKEEQYLLNEINRLNLGPMGLGGKTTALNVKIEVKPCHIASLPVAVNIECHAHRMRGV